MALELEMATEVELAWAAGFFDGEGCIHIAWGKKNSNWILMCTVSQSDKSAIKDFMQIVDVGGRIYSQRPTKGRICWKCLFTSQQAEEVLKLLLPYLRIPKKAQAEAALDFRQTFHGKIYSRNAPVPFKIQAKRERLAAEVKWLKLSGTEKEAKRA